MIVWFSLLLSQLHSKWQNNEEHQKVECQRREVSKDTTPLRWKLTKLNFDFRISSWKEYYQLWASSICENFAGILFWNRRTRSIRDLSMEGLPAGRPRWQHVELVECALWGSASHTSQSLAAIKYGQVVTEMDTQFTGQTTKKTAGIWNVNRINMHFVTILLFFSVGINTLENGSLGRMKRLESKGLPSYHSEGRFTEINIFAFVLSCS